MDEMRWQFVEDDLSLSRESLCRLGMGFSPNSGAYTFPMRDHEGQVVGVRLRYPNGKKMSARGSKNALFYESCPDYGLVLITEGPTDNIRIFTPPKGKDIKDWITVHGANRSMVEYSIKQAKQA